MRTFTRRQIVDQLIERVDVSFPLDWSPERTLREIVKAWLTLERDQGEQADRG